MIQIDRNRIYESHGYRFKNFVCLNEEEKKMILAWRNHEKVRSVMVNKDIISYEDHLKFIDSLKNREDCCYWLVIDPVGANVGVLDVVHIDRDKDVGEIGFYLNQEELGKGFQFMIETEYFVYAQLKLKYNMITIDVENREMLLYNKFLNSTFEGIKEIGGKKFYYNDHATGDIFLNCYEELTLLNYARFVKKHGKDDIVFNIINN